MYLVKLDELMKTLYLVPCDDNKECTDKTFCDFKHSKTSGHCVACSENNCQNIDNKKGKKDCARQCIGQ